MILPILLLYRRMKQTLLQAMPITIVLEKTNSVTICVFFCLVSVGPQLVWSCHFLTFPQFPPTTRQLHSLHFFTQLPSLTNHPPLQTPGCHSVIVRLSVNLPMVFPIYLIQVPGLQYIQVYPGMQSSFCYFSLGVCCFF